MATGMRHRPRQSAGHLAATLLLAACSQATGIHRVHEAGSNYYPPSAENAPPRRAGPGEYTVARGDTLFSIAFRNQIDFHDLAEWNAIPGPAYTIFPGRILRLTPPGGRAVGTASVPAAPAPTRTSPAPRASAILPPVVPSVVMPPDTATPHVAAAPAGLGPGFDLQRWEWPTHGVITRGFGVEGSKGVDISGTVGQIVIASASGKVVYSGSALQGYGELIIIKHDETYLSAYGYNRRRLVNEGDIVRAGQPIAELGTGPEQKPELHFEIRYKGRPVNPQPLLAGR